MVEPLAALKLEMLKGPREGETLEYRPRSKVRIGRVVRGNNLAIKDSGISTNHLIIHSDSESGKWMIRDLDSSNGTVVNDTKLKPDTPLELNDGDEIKIGEYTSISVHRERRNPRRGAVVENSELEREGEEIEVVEKPKRGRGRPRGVLKSEDLVEEVAVVTDSETCSEQVKIEPKRRGGGSCFGVSGAKNVDKKGNGSGVKQGLGKIWQEPDLEKMTLDDWFYYVQVSLPIGVNDEIDKICAGIRHKAKLVQEYIAQHNKDKCHS